MWVLFYKQALPQDFILIHFEFSFKIRLKSWQCATPISWKTIGTNLQSDKIRFTDPLRWERPYTREMWTISQNKGKDKRVVRIWKQWSLGEIETKRCFSRLRAKQRCLCIKALGLDCKVNQRSSFQEVQRQMWMLCPETSYMKLCMYLCYKSRLLLYDKMT